MSVITEKQPSKKKIAKICAELQSLVRIRNTNLKSRLMMENRLRTAVASVLGYSPTLEDDERKKQMKEAQDYINKIQSGEIENCEFNLKPLIESSMEGIKGFDFFVEELDKKIVEQAKKLPVAKWVQQEEQKGFGLKSLGLIIGETGDLSNYDNPGKVWRRMGLAPYESKGKMLMGATWKSGREGKLSSDEWKEFGYCPRRRSVMWNIGECLVKLNHGIYRKRYEDKKASALNNRPEWTQCKGCGGSGLNKKKKCSKCKGSGELKKRCDNHGKLVAEKLLLKNLWIQWNPDMVIEQNW